MKLKDLLPVLTVAIGAVLAWVGGLIGDWRRDRTERKKEERQESRDREIAVRIREEDASGELDKLFSKWGRDLLVQVRAVDSASPDFEARASRINSTYDVIGATAARLPEHYRRRVLEFRDVMQYSRYIGSGGYQGGFHYPEPVTIVWRSRPAIHDLLAAFLRHESLPTVTEPLDEYIVAYDNSTGCLATK